MPRPLQQISGAGIAALLVGLAWQKSQAGVLGEMLWVCHVASAIIAVALLTGSRRLLAMGLLGSLTVGLPSFLSFLIVGGHTSYVSDACHIVPPILGIIELRGGRWPGYVTPWVYAIGLLIMAASWAFVPPDLNVNLAHAPPIAVPARWAPLVTVAFLTLWLGLLFVGELFCQRIFGTEDPKA